MIEGLKRGIRSKKRRNNPESYLTQAVSGYSISDNKIVHRNSVLSKEMLKAELLRILQFGKALGVDLSGVEGKLLERLQVLETRADLGFTPLN